MKQIGFIVGTGRCGTTILAQVLNAHTHICIPPELQIIVSIGNGERLYEKYLSGAFGLYGPDEFIRLIDECCPYHLEKYFDYVNHFKRLDYPQHELGRILTDLFDHICYAYGKSIFLEQTPWYGQRLNVLRDLFPEMRVIHIVRDGRDVAVSFSRTPWWSKDIRSNLEQWAREATVIHDFGVNNPENYIEIRYEDLVLNPESELQKILVLFGLPFEREMLDTGMLIDYFSMFKGDAQEFQSIENKAWNREKRRTFFSESLYAWKKNKDYDFSIMSQNVTAALSRFRYDV